MSGVSHFPFINPLLTKLSQVLTLCGLEYHVTNIFTLILTYWCLDHHICYLLTLYRLEFYVY